MTNADYADNLALLISETFFAQPGANNKKHWHLCESRLNKILNKELSPL